MIGLEYIIAFSMATTNLFKKKVPAELVQYCTLGTVIVMNILNAIVFKGDIAMAGKESFVAGLVATGMFVAGDAVRKTIVDKKK